jgi:hypothetical protein
MPLLADTSVSAIIPAGAAVAATNKSGLEVPEMTKGQVSEGDDDAAKCMHT